ncbi:MAG: class A beta-lactamase-related serine hydrolase [Anaerolineaceae bacterium]|nr:class A beta-lactamase-related serine hydrolase [Anaerolineaceae bacterium]
MHETQKRTILIHHRWVIAAFILGISFLSACTNDSNGSNIPVATSTKALNLITQRQIEETRPTCDFTRRLTGTPRPTKTATPGPTQVLPAFPVNESLSDNQRYQLNQAAQKYISPDPEAAEATVKEMAYAKGATASLTCGPLAFAILQDAGLISPYFDLNDTWLVSPLPEKNETLFKEIFPEDEFDWLRDTTPMAEMDFTVNPLQAGDFIYTFGGNYEHMFIVTRVDETGCAYTVQNIEQGYLNGDPDDISFIIEETLLYDPDHPDEGVVYQWANPFFWKLGLTGTKGFQRFRPITPIEEPSPEKIALSETMDALISETGGKWNISIETLDGNILYERRPDESIHPASIIKVAIAAGTMHYLQEYGQEDTLSVQLSRGPVYNSMENDRSFEQLLHAMLVLSEEDAADILHENIRGSPLNEYTLLADWGLTKTRFRPRKSTTSELTELYRKLYNGELVSEEATGIILDWMLEYTPNDDLRLGRFKESLGSEIVLYNKRGSLLNPQLIVADSAILKYDDEVYLIQILAFQDKENGVIYETLEAAIGEMGILIGEWIIERNN